MQACQRGGDVAAHKKAARLRGCKEGSAGHAYRRQRSLQLLHRRWGLHSARQDVLHPGMRTAVVADQHTWRHTETGCARLLAPPSHGGLAHRGGGVPIQCPVLGFIQGIPQPLVADVYKGALHEIAAQQGRGRLGLVPCPHRRAALAPAALGSPAAPAGPCGVPLPPSR